LKELFKDLKVIELAGVLAGPSVGVFFSELGANVIKIENPKTNGDITRSWKLSTEDPDNRESAYYWSVNAGKEILFLDISQKNELDTFYELIKSTDILITNFKKGNDAKLKVTYSELRTLNPQLIYASINGFGENNSRTAYDLILQAEAGYMLINGEPMGDPVKLPVALIDVIAGHQLKEAILIALWKREKEKKGSHVSVSLFDSAIASLVNQATNWLIAKHLPKAMGSLHPNIAPYGELFQTKDQQLVTLAIGSDKQFQNLCDIINAAHLKNDPAYSHNQNRIKNRDQLFLELKPAIESLDFDDMYKACLEKEIPIGKIRNLKEVFELPEAQAMLKPFHFENKTITTVNSVAFKFLD
jgi:crotonobetainyl-CoA:carnitine CoA-transferase CaiB-like acyl-CoA transferase